MIAQTNVFSLIIESKDIQLQRKREKKGKYCIRRREKNGMFCHLSLNELIEVNLVKSKEKKERSWTMYLIKKKK